MAIIRKEAYFNSSTGKNKIHCMIWQDDAVKPIALFQIAHGMSEHIERYDDFACFLAGHGFIVCGNDHLGHGKSVNSLDDLGYMDDKNGHIRMVDDMHILHHIMHKRYPDLPYFLFGHSMGSFLSRSYAAHFGKELAGAIFCGTGELPASLEGVVSAFDKVVDKIGPHANADLLFKIGNGVFNAQFFFCGHSDFDDVCLSFSRRVIAVLSCVYVRTFHFSHIRPPVKMINARSGMERAM